MKLFAFMGHEFSIKVAKYQNNGHLAIDLYEYEKGYTKPYARLTVNLSDDELFDFFSEEDKKFAAFVDTNNVPDAENFIKLYHLGRFTGFYGPSGWMSYPMYIFDKELLSEYDPDGMKLLTA